MARQRKVYRLACVNLDEIDRMAVTSAINSSSSSLGVEFVWTIAPLADIHLVDVSQTEALPEFPVILRYTARRNGRAVDLYRPIHARTVLEALTTAITEVERLRTQTPPTPEGPVRRYRGAIVTEPASAPAAEGPETPREPRGQVTYRGVKLER